MREMVAALEIGRLMLQRMGLAGVWMVASATLLRHLLTRVCDFSCPVSVWVVCVDSSMWELFTSELPPLL